MRYGANPTILDNLQQSALHHAARYMISRSYIVSECLIVIRFANIEILMVLLGKFVALDIFLQSAHGFTPLHSAVSNDNIDCVNALIDTGMFFLPLCLNGGLFFSGGAKLVNVTSYKITDNIPDKSNQGTTAFHLAAEYHFQVFLNSHFIP